MLADSRGLRPRLLAVASTGLLQERKPDLTKARFYPVSSCKGCHNHVTDVSLKTTDYTRDFVLLSEFDIWRKQDRHSLAFLALKTPRGEQIGRNLGIDVTKADMCLSCHAFASLAADRKFSSFQMEDGVSCDGCHGPAEHWFADHSFSNWRDQAAHTKEALGMYNVRDPEKRAELCSSCHVGSPAEGKVITHAMYAAGHPPLPGFELASFSANLPPHWRAVNDVPHFARDETRIADAAFDNTRLVLAGSLVALRKSLELLASRADFAAKETPQFETASTWPPAWLAPQTARVRTDPKARWPELVHHADEGARSNWPEIAMAQLDCYACHHDLKSESWRQIRGYKGGRPGRPQVQEWPFVLVDLFLKDELRTDFAEKRAALHSVFNRQPFGDPDEVVSRVQTLLEALPAVKDFVPKLDSSAAADLLKKLARLDEHFYPDYDSARQIAWACRAIYLDGWNSSHAKRDEVMKVFAELDEMVNLTPHSLERKSTTEARERLCENFAASGLQQLALNSDGFLVPLDSISSKELAAALQRISHYDPIRFRASIRKLAKAMEEY